MFGLSKIQHTFHCPTQTTFSVSQYYKCVPQPQQMRPFSSSATIWRDHLADIKKLPSWVPTKKKKLLEDYYRRQWHERQRIAAQQKTSTTKNGAKNSNVQQKAPTMSKNQQFKQIDINNDIYRFIKENDLGKVRVGKVLNARKERGQRDLDSREISPSESLFKKRLKFVAAAPDSAKFYENQTVPEVAFVGRSNVGKSTLLNALTHSSVVACSDKPGTTRTINWFQSSDKLLLVDLPGYGFAIANDQDKLKWQALTKDYLTKRRALRRVFLLVDARVGVKQTDVMMMKLLNGASVSFQVILTKCDLVDQKTLARMAVVVKEHLKPFNHCLEKIMFVSSRNKSGLHFVRKEIYSFTTKEEEATK